jgi:hypothetical protein
MISLETFAVMISGNSEAADEVEHPNVSGVTVIQRSNL